MDYGKLLSLKVQVTGDAIINFMNKNLDEKLKKTFLIGFSFKGSSLLNFSNKNLDFKNLNLCKINLSKEKDDENTKKIEDQFRLQFIKRLQE
jgi:hypothetical protein